MVKLLTSFAAALAVFSSIALSAPVSTSTLSSVATPTTITTNATATLANATATTIPSIREDDQTVTTAAADLDERVMASDIMYHGVATFFHHGYGACNEVWNGEKEPTVALSATLMGASSWGNPSCGRKVRVYHKNDPSKSVVARVVDKCPGAECARGSLDLSPYAFRKLDHQDRGIIPIVWHFM